jgi:hypothetical protein
MLPIAPSKPIMRYNTATTSPPMNRLFDPAPDIRLWSNAESILVAPPQLSRYPTEAIVAISRYPIMRAKPMHKPPARELDGTPIFGLVYEPNQRKRGRDSCGGTLKLALSAASTLTISAMRRKSRRFASDIFFISHVHRRCNPKNLLHEFSSERGDKPPLRAQP